MRWFGSLILWCPFATQHGAIVPGIGPCLMDGRCTQRSGKQRAGPCSLIFMGRLDQRGVFLLCFLNVKFGGSFPIVQVCAVQSTADTVHCIVISDLEAFYWHAIW